MTSTQSIDPRAFPLTLREAREAAGFTQRELGEKAGVNYSQISRYEQGLAIPRPGMLLKLAEALNVSPDYLRSRDDLAYIDVAADDGQRMPFAVTTRDMETIRELAAENGISAEEQMAEMLRAGMRHMEDMRQEKARQKKESRRKAG